MHGHGPLNRVALMWTRKQAYVRVEAALGNEACIERQQKAYTDVERERDR